MLESGDTEVQVIPNDITKRDIMNSKLNAPLLVGFLDTIKMSAALLFQALHEQATPTTPTSSRRGRPRLDPDSDDVLG